MILVDSSVWIAAWKGSNEPLRQKLALLVESSEAAINELIRTELLQGARDRIHQKKLAVLLEPVHIESLSSQIWQAAPEYFIECREIGITLTTVDCLIATQAVKEKIALWSLDQIFSSLPEIPLFYL